MIRKGNWKLIEAFDPVGVELYNLTDDVGETNNLATKNPNQRDALLKELAAWRESVRAEPMLQNPNFEPGLPGSGRLP